MRKKSNVEREMALQALSLRGELLVSRVFLGKRRAARSKNT